MNSKELLALEPGSVVKQRTCLVGQCVAAMPKVFSQERWRWMGALAAISICSSMNGNLAFIKDMSLNVWFMGIGATGTGKSESFRPIEWLLGQVEGLSLISGNATKAALLDILEERYATAKAAGSPVRTLRAHGAIVNDEWTDVMPAPDQEFLSALIKCWGDQEVLTEFRRHSKKKGEFEIPRPTICMLAAIQPKKFKIIFPESSGAEGFSRRMLFSYELPKPQQERKNLLASQVSGKLKNQNINVLKSFVPKLNALYSSVINVIPDQSAADVWGAFMDIGSEPLVGHVRAQDWNTTREQYMAKLGALFAIARVIKNKPIFGEVYLTGEDLLAGIDFVRWCETTYETFYATQIDMSQEHLWAELAQFTRMPKTEAEVKRWLSDRMPSYMVKQTWFTAIDTTRLVKAPKVTKGFTRGTAQRYCSPIKRLG